MRANPVEHLAVQRSKRSSGREKSLESCLALVECSLKPRDGRGAKGQMGNVGSYPFYRKEDVPVSILQKKLPGGGYLVYHTVSASLSGSAGAGDGLNGPGMALNGYKRGRA